MASQAPVRFEGFRREAIQFLADLTANNERSWFQPRKADYERLLRQPFAALAAALDERFAARGIPLHADPSRSPYRIYRDVRFSTDKSPYKTHVGASFPWVDRADGRDRVDRPEGSGHGVGGYFHLAPGEIYVGGGMWHPEPARLAAFRAAVLADPAAVHRAIDDPGFATAFGLLSGDRLKRAPAGVPPDHPEIELLKLKDVTFGRRLSDDEALTLELPDLLADAFAAALPVLRFLAGLRSARGDR